MILITGGSGLLGRKLTEALKSDGHEVRHLSRSANSAGETPTFVWDIKNATLDKSALDGVETIVHLAGASIADGRWTSSRKKEILDSRIKSANLLAETIFTNELPVHTFISANAIGIYGNREDEWLYEDSGPEDDWLAKVCKEWEQSVDQFTEWGMRTVTARLGLVLSKEGGALAKMLGPARKGVNPVLGTGKQWYSWIHINDAVDALKHLIENESLKGPYNVVSPNPVRQKEFADKIDKVLDKKTLKPPSPAFLLKLAMGKMAQIVLASARVSSEKLETSGFKFNYKNLDAALEDLVK